MLNFQQKQELFFNCLNEKNNSYSDDIRKEILFYFDFLENDLGFLNRFSSEIEIKNFTNMLVSKIIMNKYQDGVHNIIENYCC
ncbi:hypothetical protein C0147_06975 [Moraxella catarrhalis]|uniref:hypothetical protein n=1 Tax=Moraxella catarrhalis TaxID=480 RepID=UPI00128D5471|nr:hypothetical protein [Moraxella catarrhalis]MPX61913.1 hypothetical protein [Moraxella catarrhalis]